MRIPKGVFKIAAIAADETTAYAFAGIEVKRLPDDKIIASATDGRRAVRVTWKEDRREPVPELEAADVAVEGFTAIVPAVDAKKADAAIPKGDRYPFVMLDEARANGRLHLISPGSATTVTVDSPAMEGLFPPVQEVVPQYEIVSATPKEGSKAKQTAVRIGVNAALLAELLKAMLAASPNADDEYVVLEVPAIANRPIKIIRETEDVEVTGIQMPTTLPDKYR